MNSFRIVRNNLKRSCNRRTSFIINLIIPIIVVVLGIFANSVSKPSFSIGTINGDNATSIVKALSQTTGITVSEASLNTIKIDLITGKYSAVVDFSKSDYELFSVKDKKTNSELKQIINRYKTTPAPINIEEIVGTEMSIAERTIAFMVLFLMITATVTAALMIKDKNNGTMKRYKYSPQKLASYVLGNFIYNYLITFLQFFISITFMQVIGTNIGISYGNLLITGVWLSGIATAFGTFISSIFQKEMYANLFAAFIALILSLVGGTFITYDNMPTLLQKVSIISPLRWFIDITQNMENGINWFENARQVVALSVMILTLLIAAACINKKQKSF